MTKLHHIPIYAFDAFTDSVWRDDRATERLANLAVFTSDRTYIGLKTKISSIVGAYNRNPNLRGLLYLIASWIWSSHPKSHSFPDNLHPSAFALEEDDPPKIQLVTQLLAAAAEHSHRPDPIILGHILNRYPSLYGSSLLRSCLESDLIPTELRRSYILTILHQVEGIEPERTTGFRYLLRRALDARRSGLIDREVWIDKLQLPAFAYSILQRPSN